jgi:hypothetical protein
MPLMPGEGMRRMSALDPEELERLRARVATGYP